MAKRSQVKSLDSNAVVRVLSVFNPWLIESVRQFNRSDIFPKVQFRKLLRTFIIIVAARPLGNPNWRRLILDGFVT